MKTNNYFEIINLCLSIDVVASRVYLEMSSISKHEDLRVFWREMSQEEETHVKFWKKLREACKRDEIPQIFEDPQATQAKLERIIPQVRSLLKLCKETEEVSRAFILAYRLEFYMLHSEIEMLFRLHRFAGVDSSPADKYDEHISRFIKKFAEYADLTPELKLLGETIHSLRQENKKLAYQASRDSLTGLLNRRSFLSMSTQLSHLARRHKWNVGIMMFDIDDFKTINDNYGHECGDDVLKSISNLLKSSFRNSDIISRYGGEEFIAFLVETDGNDVVAIAEKIRKRIEESMPNGISFTTSIGVCNGMIKSDVEKELQALVRQADSNLYSAKRSGKNQVCASILTEIGS